MEMFNLSKQGLASVSVCTTQTHFPTPNHQKRITTTNYRTTTRTTPLLPYEDDDEGERHGGQNSRSIQNHQLNTLFLFSAVVQPELIDCLTWHRLTIYCLAVQPTRLSAICETKSSDRRLLYQMLCHCL